MRTQSRARDERIPVPNAARVVMNARDERGGIARNELRPRDFPHEFIDAPPHPCLFAREKRTTAALGNGLGVRHDEGSKKSFTLEPLGKTVPVTGSTRARRPVPKTVGTK